MCGRYTLIARPAALRERFGLAAAPEETRPRYNVAPSQTVAIVPNQDPRLLQSARWGLIPSWAKDAAIGHRMINARAETVAEKPAFRAAFTRRRCLVPADGFYEWQRQGKTGKQPFYITARDRAPLALAGLWETWQGPDGAPVTSCTIVTTAANAVLAPIHERMPVILAAADFDAWLDPRQRPAAELAPLLVPCPADWLEAWPVTPWVNSPTHDDPACIAPA